MNSPPSVFFTYWFFEPPKSQTQFPRYLHETELHFYYCDISDDKQHQLSNVSFVYVCMVGVDALKHKYQKYTWTQRKCWKITKGTQLCKTYFCCKIQDSLANFYVWHVVSFCISRVTKVYRLNNVSYLPIIIIIIMIIIISKKRESAKLSTLLSRLTTE